VKQVATNNQDFRVKNGLVVEQDAVINGTITATEFIGDGTGLTGVTSYTATDFAADFATKTTTDLAEGTNLYYTTTRAQDAITVDATLSKTAGQISLPTSGVTASSYGSQTSIPVISVDAQGRITSASTETVSSTLPIAADTGTDSISLLTDTLTFTGGEGIDTSINASTNTITIAAKDATTSNKGVASFNSSDFSVSSGAVSISNVNLGTQTTGNYVASVANGSYITGGSSGSEGATLTLAVDATSANTVSKVVARDSLGDFSAGTITASLTGNVTGNVTGSSSFTTGNAATATTLQTSRTISLGGDLSGSASFNGSADVTITATVAADSVALGTDTTGNYVSTIAGTTNQVSVSGSGSETAAVTLSLPQNIHTGATPQFAGATLTGALAMGSSKITDLGTPTNATDATTKQYVDEVAQGLKAAPAVEVATTANLTATYSNGTAGVGATLTATSNGAFPTIDGITVSSTAIGQNGVLVKNQSTAAQNGRYNLTQVGNGSTPWILTRCGVCDEASEIPGSYVFVKAGTTQESTGWVAYVANPSTFIVGTDNITYFQFSGAGTFTAGTGLTLTGSAFSVNASQTQITAVGTLSSGTWNASVIDGQYGGTGVANTGKTITLGGSLTTSGAHTTTLTTSGNTNVTLPTTGTLATIAGTETLTNKIIAAESNTISGLTNSNLSGSAGITNANLANNAVTVGSTSISLGSSATTIAGLSSVTSTTFVGALTGNALTATNVAYSGLTGAVPTWNQNTTGTAANVTGTVAIANGGTGATTAAAARTNLGATTLGGNLFTLANVAAIAFPRFNADNTVSSLSAADFRTAIGAGTSSTTGTVTSVGGTGTVSGITLTGTVTASGNLTLGGTLAVLPSNFASQTANTVLAAPNGAAGVPTFRAIVAADVPTLNQNTTGNAATATTLQTARTINSVQFNGSANITVTANTTNALTIGTGLSGTSFNGSGAVTIAIDSTVATLTGTQTLTNKTIAASNNTISGLTNANLSGSAGISNANLANSSITVGSTAIALGASATTIAGLTSVTSTGFTGALTGNATTATTLQTGRTIALTGDVTYTSGSFNGSANVTGTATLANSGATAGTYGDATNIPQIAVDVKGRITSVSNVAVSIPSGSLTFTGDVTGTGSTGSSTALTLASVGTAGTYTKVTTDVKGRVTSGTTLAASDIPNLDASKLTSGIIDAARLPSYVDDVLEFTNLAGFPTTGETGKLYVALDTNKVYRWSGTTYIFITSGAVDSVAGKTGVVTLVKADVGLGNVDNTSDAAKPVSTAQQTALNLKANIASPVFTGNVTGLGVSTGTSFNAITGLATVAPLAAGTAAVGTSTLTARQDHVHPLQTTVSGNAATATTLQNSRTLWGQSFNGSSNVTGGLTGVTSIGFAAEASDSASISTTISGTATFFDFNLTDDNNNDEWRWRFTPSGATVYNAMRLVPTTNTTANLVVSGTVTAPGFSGPLTGNASTATTLQTTRAINGTNFDGSAAITTANWGTARDINGTSVNGSVNYAIGRIYDTNYRRFTNPGGGEYVTTASSVTGAIEVVFPNIFSNGMYKLVIEVYEYTTNESFTVYAAGHTSGTAWFNTTAYIIGNPGVDRRFNVRFGRNAANKAVVYIGEVGSVWSYPQVFLTEFQCGYAGFQDNSAGWAINFRTAALENVTQTISNCQIGYAVSTNTATSVVLRDGSGNFSAGTITAALSGNATTATTLQTARAINGTNFNGSADITTANWGTARTITIGSTGKSVNGSANVSWTLAEIGAQAAGNYVTTDTTQTISGAKTFSAAITHNATSTRDKYRVWSDNNYIIGMQNSITFGAINNDYAMTFQMNNADNRGFWWGDASHTTAQGAMALSTNGKLTVAHSVRIGFGETDTVVPGAVHRLEVNGSFAATSKSFLIDHPTKSGQKLQYGSLEGPELGVYVRGKLVNVNVIELPDYWTGLVHADSITVNLTAAAAGQQLYVERVENNRVHIANETGKPINCYYTVYGERKDVDKLQVEIG